MSLEPPVFFTGGFFCLPGLNNYELRITNYELRILVPIRRKGMHSGCVASSSSRLYPIFATACNAGRERIPCGAWDPGMED